MKDTEPYFYVVTQKSEPVVVGLLELDRAARRIWRALESLPGIFDSLARINAWRGRSNANDLDRGDDAAAIARVVALAMAEVFQPLSR